MVYFIQPETAPGEPIGDIKIGFTAGKSAYTRLASLQTAHAQKLLLLGTTNSHKEKDLHERFAHLRIRRNGEWFKPSATLLLWIQQNAVLTADGHRQLARATAWGKDEGSEG